MNYYYKTMLSSVGLLKLIASDKGLAAILWEHEPPNRIRYFEASEMPGHPVLEETEHQLEAYFAGSLKNFTIPLDQLGTPFQQQVWKALQEIPFGQTRTYGQLATLLGDIRLSRAVGSANHRNPVSIVIPCHRVVGANGSLTGFAGGLEVKARLLALEKRGSKELHAQQATLLFSTAALHN